VRYHISVNGHPHRLELQRTEHRWICRLDGREVSANVCLIDERTLSLLVEGHSFEVRREPDEKIFLRENRFQVSVEDPRSWRGRKRAGGESHGPQKLTASMPGKIVRVLAAEGEKIGAGQGIAVVEAMKMQNELKSPKEGTLKKLLARPGMNVNAGDVLAIVE
jgi:biotin carboxyl carrier protein